MDKNELIKKYTGAGAQDAEDKLVLARVLDKLEACEKGHALTNTKFLNEHQRALAENMLAHLGGTRHVFYGGYEGAQRTVLVFLPDYIEPEEINGEENTPLAYIRAEYSPENKPSHRDFLGSLMGCGIQRDTVGDILPGEGSCDLIVLNEISPYVLTNLESAGKARLRTALIKQEQISVPTAEFKIIRDTVASLRLDNVVSSGFIISREKAADAIRAGKVSLNYMECVKPDKPIAEGDRISLRGMGKIELELIGGQT
jgi:RNA-binding protein YlmH